MVKSSSLSLNLNFQKLFEGYQHTPTLWWGTLLGMRQYKLASTTVPFQPLDSSKKLRLGKWVEHFAAHQIANHNDLDLVTDSLQIRQEKQTLGELDLLFKNKSQLSHLECVYKFYLYDYTKSYDNNLEPWIGPNRTDALMLKLDKLRLKQLPLLQHPVTQSYIHDLGYESRNFAQYVQFRAQLFLPLNNLDIELRPLNRKCIMGFYCNINDLDQFEGFKFYIPLKLEWLAIPSLEVDWISFSDAYKTIKDQCKSHRSPMIWLKDPEDNLQKAFVTWW